MCRGHFFCDYCDDVKFIRFTGRLLTVCPDCHRTECRWIVDGICSPDARLRRFRPVSQERGAALFAAMKNAF